MYIQYRIDVKGIVRDQLLNLKPNNSDINNIEFIFNTTDTSFDVLFVKFYFTNNVRSKEEGEAKTKPLLNDLINLMIYQYNAAFKEPNVHSHDIEEKKLIATASITLYNLQSHELTDSDCNWLAVKINDQNLINKLKFNDYFRQYRSILTIEDSVSRYLLLYGLLFEIKGNQKSVDKYIENKEKNVIKLRTTKINSNTKKRKKDKETIYTWYRNQAQHIQSITDIEEVTKRFNELEVSLKVLVYKAIKSQI